MPTCRWTSHVARALLAAIPAATFLASVSTPSASADAPARAPASVAADALTNKPVAVPYNEEHPVLAYYYAWWEADVLARGINKPVRYPIVPFGQIIDDTALVREHIREAQAAGIDGFVVNQTSDMTRLLAIAQEYDFRVSVEIDATRSPEAQLAEFYANAGHPAMVRHRGRPVVFFWRASALSDAAWRGIRNRLDPDHVAVWLVDGDNFNALRSDVWDGISPYQIAWSPTPETQLPGWGAKAQAAAPGKLYVPPVAPGCNDSVVRATTCVQDRGDGTYYQRSLNGALASNPNWAVIVSTFNEWMEDTQIEPSPAYGDLYLQLTRQFATEFKGAVPAPPCC